VEDAIWGAHAEAATFQPYPLDLHVLTADLALGGK
jgi:hypothetical protein